METDGSSRFIPTQEESDDEEINIEFPTELIPDEYDHENKNELVFIFRDKEAQQQSLPDILIAALEYHKFSVPKENQIDLTGKVDLIENVELVAGGDYSKNTCLIVVIIGEANIFKEILFQNTFMKVWSPFINNVTLKYKPKIFLFFEYKKEEIMVTDYTKMSVYSDDDYDVPSEADVLIVYQRSSDINKKKKQFGYIGNFCEDLKQYGQRDDLVSILTFTETKQRPLLISTLRKKFYVSSSKFREHYFDIYSNGRNMEEVLEKLKTRLRKLLRNRGRVPYSQASTPISENPPPIPSTSQKAKAKETVVADGPTKNKVSKMQISTTKIQRRPSKTESVPVPKPIWRS